MAPSFLKYSIVVPTYNRPLRLPTCLAALARLDFPREKFEVIIADDGSDHPLDEVVAPFREKMTLQLVRLPHGGVSSARNGGAARASGEFLVFTDDDCQMEPDWLRIVDGFLAKNPAALVGGQLVNALPGNIFSTTNQLILDMVYAHYNRQWDQSQFVAGANIALSRQNYLAIGGCDTRFPPYGAEDRYLCHRWLQQGWPIFHVPAARVQHAHHLSFRSYFRMYFCYGRGAFVFHQIRQQERSGGRSAETKFYQNIRNLLFPVRQVAGPLRKIQVAGLLVWWQVANTLGYFYQWASTGIGGQPNLPNLGQAPS